MGTSGTTSRTWCTRNATSDFSLFYFYFRYALVQFSIIKKTFNDAAVVRQTISFLEKKQKVQAIEAECMLPK